MGNPTVRSLLFAALLFTSFTTLAQSLLGSSEGLFFDPTNAPRVGIEVELAGLSMEQTADVLQKHFGGRIKIKNKQRPGGFIEIAHKIVGSKIGDVLVKWEANETTNAEYETLKTKLTTLEIVTDPLNVEGVELLQTALNELRSLGAEGSENGKALANQFNFEIGKGERENMKVETTLNILRNVFCGDHFEQIDRELKTPPWRAKYLGHFSPEMLKRICDPDYKPSWSEFYMDFMYRQALEHLNVPDAWTMAEQDARSLLRNKLKHSGYEIALKTYKWNYVRVSSLLMFMQPDDWLTNYLIGTTWFKPHPILEFRQPNSDFNVNHRTYQFAGLVQESERAGAFSHDEHVAKLLNMNTRDIGRLREAYFKSLEENKPYVVRLLLEDPHGPRAKPDDPYYKMMIEFPYRRSTPVFMAAGSKPAKPLRLAGESVVFHRLPVNALTLVGKYNPGLGNPELSTKLENKYAEYQFWQQHAPGAMPASVSLTEILNGSTDVETLRRRLDERFPSGWVLKGVLDSATQVEYMISHKMDLAHEMQIYRAGKAEFQALIASVKQDIQTESYDVFIRKLRKQPGFIGWRLKNMVNYPDKAFAQAWMPLVAEYRVEVIAGRVLGNGSTLLRYGYNDTSLKEREDEIERVEEFAQNLVHQLPKEARGMPMGMDIGITRDGNLTLIESNPQGNSGFLADDPRSIKVLDKFLLKYPAQCESALL
jgi:hypothetical protein